MHPALTLAFISVSLFSLCQRVSCNNNALCDVYQSTSIADRINSGHMTGWECFGGEPDAELCEDWSGVKCDRQGHVKYLDISGQNLTGTLPSSLGNLDQLQQFFVDSNFLNGTIPDTLSRLSRLSSLSLQNNFFEGTIPSGFGELSKLKALHLDHNNLTGTIPFSLGGLPLSDLTASYNLLTGPLPASLGAISRKGRVVDFSYNHLQGEVPEELCLARNMFLISNNVTNRCKEICHDKRYRDGNIHILSNDGGSARKAEREQIEEAQRWAAEELEAKEMEDFKHSLKDMINL